MLRGKNKSRYGCSECKRRHMKCDETRPCCVNCKTGNRVCSLRNLSTNFPHSHRTRHASSRSQGNISHQQESGGNAENISITVSPRRGIEHKNQSLLLSPESNLILPPPYSTVRELETGPSSLWPGPYRTSTGTPLDDHQRAVDHQPLINAPRSTGLGEHLFQCLAEIGMSVADAQDMFDAFRDRISPMIPSFYATSFSHLPSQPLFVLAVIYTVARYLPDSASLRSRVFCVLRRLLADLVMQPAGDQQTKEEVFENMHGLVILYACCEATGPRGSAEDQLDALTVKSIVEGYAVKFKIGIGSSLSVDAPGLLPQVWLVWLYTMSHYSAVIHGSSQTLSSSADIRRAKLLLEQHIDNPQVQRLLAEYDLCLIWEQLSVQRRVSLQLVHDALHEWQRQWNDFIVSEHGRQLHFHYLFARFYLVTHLLDDAGEPYVALPESLEAGKDFILYLLNMSPIYKDRLRYACDFAFVLMAYVGLYILRSLGSRAIPVARGEEFLLLVKDLALLIQSCGFKVNTRPTIYGCALEGICKQYESNSSGSYQLDAPPPPPSVPLSPSLPPMMELRQPITEETSWIRLVSANQQQQLSRVSGDAVAPMNLASAPEWMQHSRFPSSELWMMDPVFSVFDGIMAGIPVPEGL